MEKSQENGGKSWKMEEIMGNIETSGFGSWEKSERNDQLRVF